MSVAPAKPRRRTLRFSLRTLFVFVTLLAVWLGYQTDSAIKQRRAVEMVHRYGGRVFYVHDRDGTSNSPSTHPPQAPWLQRLIGEDYFLTVSGVDLKGYVEFGPLWKLGERVPDDEFALLADLPYLEYFDSDSGRLTDERAKVLAELGRLETLRAHGAEITDEGLRQLGQITSLTNLTLWANGDPIRNVRLEVTDRGLAHLRRLSRLQILDLRRSRVTDAVLRELGGLPSLWGLSLDYADISDGGLQELARLPKLRRLSLVGTRVTDAGLAYLQGMPLRELYLEETEVTSAAARQFERATGAKVQVSPQRALPKANGRT